MKNFTTVVLLTLIFTQKIFGNEIKKDSIKVSHPALIKNEKFANHSIENIDKIDWNTINKYYYKSQKTENDRSIAEASFKVIEKHDSWVDKFSNEDITELPLGVKHTVSNIQYAIGITRATVNKDFTELTVFARITLPQKDQKGEQVELFFGANNVKLSHKGGIVGDAKLVLLGDVNIPFNGNKWMLSLNGGFSYETGVTENTTFVTIDCDGVKNLGIDGEVEFSRSIMIPIESNGEVNDTHTLTQKKYQSENGTLTKSVPYRVKGAFKIIVSDWNDIIVDIKLNPFVITKKRNGLDYSGNFQFYMSQATLDFSDLRNSNNINFPDYYRNSGLLFPDENAWKGIYVSNLEVRLPKEFKTSKTIENNNRIRISAHNLLIDDYGISGSFYGNNLFQIDEGRTESGNAWAYSLDSIGIEFAANKLIRGNFEGRILLPVSEKKSQESKEVGLAYQGIISEEEYLLKVSSLNTIDFSIWKAKAQLYPNSSLEMRVVDGNFRPKAILHGKLAIRSDQINGIENETNKEKKIVELNGIEFKNLILQTGSSPFSIGYLGYRDEVSLSGLPVTISNIWAEADKNNASLNFNLKVNLMGENNGFCADAGLHIIGGIEEENHQQTWKFRSIKLDKIALKADLGGFTMIGGLELMNDDPVYGNGFAANLDITFEALDEMKISAKGIFGKKDFRYWQFDAMSDFPPIGSGLKITGFAGGASYRMSRANLNSNSSHSISGLSYIPDKNAGLGLKAMVKFVAVTKESFSGNANFSMIFNRYGGINHLDFYGFGTFMNVDVPGMENINKLMNVVKSKEKIAMKFIGGEDALKNSWAGRTLLDRARSDFPQVPKEKMTISADLGISYDFQNNVLHGELETYINTPGGFIKGIGPNGRAGRAVLHFDEQKWYIYLGTPEDRMGIKMGIGAARFKTGAYFMIGSKLKGFPSPPKEVTRLLNEKQETINFMRNENLLSSGKGFAFGSDISVSTGDLNFLIFYANFKAGAGFDLMLKNYNNTKCANTNEQVGINGWYASGQGYAYLEGELGVKVKLFSLNKKITILSSSAAILLQAKAPNPIWMKGYLAGNYNILGGMVKGSYNFEVTIGEECEFVQDEALGGLQMISNLTPSDNSKDVDVFAIPQATFNMTADKPFVIREGNSEKTYKMVLDKFTIKQNNKEIIGEIKWSKNKNSVKFISRDILAPYQNTHVKIQVSFLEKINGTFKQLMFNGKPAIETSEIRFKTGGAPTTIPLHNVKLAYPVINQKFFLSKEYNQGCIELERGQSYLFDTNEWISSIVFKKSYSNKNIKLPIKYLASSKKITFSLPDIDQNSNYELVISSKSMNKTSSKTSTSFREVNIGNNGNNVNIRNRKSNNVSKDSQIDRLKYSFKTSIYSTFKEKIKSIKPKDQLATKICSDVIILVSKMYEHEPFDLAEIKGTACTNFTPLVSIEAVLDDKYYLNDMKPNIYNNQILNKQNYYQNKTKYGIPPKKAVLLKSNYLNYVKNNFNIQKTKTSFPYYYGLPVVYKSHWTEIKNKALDNLENSSDFEKKMLTKFFPFMRHGYYKVKLTYKHPLFKEGSNEIYEFMNPINFR